MVQRKKNTKIIVANARYSRIMQNETLSVKNRLIQPIIKNSYKKKNACKGFLKILLQAFFIV